MNAKTFRSTSIKSGNQIISINKEFILKKLLLA